MPKFIRKVAEVEAFQIYDGDDESYNQPLPYWAQQAVDSGKMFSPSVCQGYYIETLEGRMTAKPGDWIVKGIKGELYPVKPDIFKLIYDPAKLEDGGPIPETRPSKKDEKYEYHVIGSERSEQPCVAQWLGGKWHCIGENTPITAAEMWRRGWRDYLGPITFAGMQD